MYKEWFDFRICSILLSSRFWPTQKILKRSPCIWTNLISIWGYYISGLFCSLLSLLPKVFSTTRSSSTLVDINWLVFSHSWLFKPFCSISPEFRPCYSRHCNLIQSSTFSDNGTWKGLITDALDSHYRKATHGVRGLQILQIHVKLFVHRLEFCSTDGVIVGKCLVHEN